jgi:hypothetical protein
MAVELPSPLPVNYGRKEKGVFMTTTKRKYFVLLPMILFLLGIVGCGPDPTPTPSHPAPTVTISISPSQIVQGNSATITWSTTNATSITAADSWSGSKAAYGTEVVAPTTSGTFKYTLNVSGLGGSASGSAPLTVTPAAPPTLTITVSPSLIVLGGSATLTWSSANATTAVASGDWSGPQSVSGSMTVSPTSSGTFHYTLKVTGPGGSVTKTATLTVNPQGPWINSMTNNLIYADSRLIIGDTQVNGTGFQAGCTLHLGYFGDMPLATGTAPNQILVKLQIAPTNYYPAFDPVSLSCPNGNSNTIWLAFFGNQPTLVIDHSNGLLLQLQQGTGYMFTFPMGPTGMLASSGSIGVGHGNGIAFDEQTGLVGISNPVSNGETDWFKINGQPFVGSGDGGQAGANMAIAAIDGYGLMTEPTPGLLQCFRLVQSNNPIMFSASVGNEPWAMATVHLGNEAGAIVYSREDTSLWWVSIPTMAVKGSLVLQGISKASVTRQNGSTIGGWQVAAFSSGPAAGKAVFLSSYDGILVVVDIATMTEVVRVDLVAALGTTEFPMRLAADEANGSILVAFADVNAGLSRFASVNPVTGAVTPLAATSSLLAVGFGVSTDGTQMYACQLDKCEALSTDPAPTSQSVTAASTTTMSSKLPPGTMLFEYLSKHR